MADVFSGSGELGEVLPPPIPAAPQPDKDESRVPKQSLPGLQPNPDGSPPVSAFNTQFSDLTNEDQIRDAQLKLKRVYSEKTENDLLQERQLKQKQDRYNAQLEQMREREGASAAEIHPWNEQTMAPKKTGLWEKFGSPGFVLSMFASAFTALPMNSAMQAGGAAINAINEGDFEARKEAMDVWKQNTELALKRLEEQHKTYSEILQQQSHDLEATRLGITMAATRYGDETLKAYAEAGMYPEMDKLIQTRYEAAQHMAQAKQALLEQEVVTNALNGHPANEGEQITHKDAKGNPMAGGDARWYTGKDPQAAYADVLSKINAAKRAGTGTEGPYWDVARQLFPNDPEKQADWVAKERQKERGSGAGTASLWAAAKQIYPDDPVKQAEFVGDLQGKLAAGKLNAQGKGPEQVAKIGDAIYAGLQPPDTSRLYGMAGPLRAYLADKGYSLARAELDWKAAEKQVLSLNGPQMVRYIGLAKSVVNTIDEVKRLSHALHLDNIPAFNKFQLATYIQAHASGKEHNDAVAYLGAVNTLKEEFANLANGGYAPTEPAWNLANDQINGNYDIGALDTSLSEVQRLINFRLTAIPGLRTLGPGAPNPYMPAEPAEKPAQFPNSGDPMGLR